MKKSDRLLDIAKSNDIEIVEKYMENSKIEGLYSDNTVLINTIIQEEKYNEVLGHELGHHFTLDGNNLLEHQCKDLQEFFADAWSYREVVPLHKLAQYKLWEYEEWEVLECENITHDFLSKTFEYYKNRFGYDKVKVENYIITFCPEFNVECIY
ncbi:hypothetical protein [Parvimonas micra]|uniref:IrrE N-terminal-like domain-containing protein n=1 Tax=Parvimonas micra ATCC 33270 TaxID=411465 RepID=A8SKK3_9FIRM|nr:hypothetical protein [Parvimonas micra]EDP24127.1 hypothetical protein PEPMIC_00707 [Parvimonas micra ATCC 33270]RSB90391.1 hypothetical protein EGS00_01070 [Parvimonas micra]VEH96829.1 Uncharacterised protein [Parvimonas micra]